MKNKHITIGRAEASWNVAGTRILKYSLEMYHDGLNEHKLISAPEIDILENKANLQAQKWIEKWGKIELKRKLEKEKNASIEEANIRTEEAVTAIEDINNLLNHTLAVNDAVNWNTLKKSEEYSVAQPSKPKPPEMKKYPDQPIKEEPKFNFIEKIIKSRKDKKLAEVEKQYDQDLLKWKEEKDNIDKMNLQLKKTYDNKIKEWESKLIDWKKNKRSFIKEQKKFNEKIENMKESYFNLNEDAIIEYCDMVLNNSVYPDSFPKNYELEYNSENKILVVEYQLPSVDCFPTLREVKYLASKKELKETYLPESHINKMFDEAMYKIALRTIHEIYEADSANAINAISFNGWVKAINKATGKEENNCILTIQVVKNEFINIDLANVDPKMCFKSLKGIASSRLSNLTPIQPILQISRVDKRFVDSYDVANQIDDTTNLAAMNWEDFEHLIREIFEKEFKSNGGEVKVTQASKDGGVDAVAFDPDPIRGGKIVIQAKRYTNTVSVSAVRDLYGAVVNEGATKGILVSTADYGPDAYEFAKAKPLTLLNGSNLLHLLEKHGYRAKIDLREAKKILAEKKNA